MMVVTRKIVREYSFFLLVDEKMNFCAEKKSLMELEDQMYDF